MSDNPRGPGTVPPPASPVPPAARPIQSAGQAHQPAGDAPGTVPLETAGEQGQGGPRPGGPRRVRLTVSRVDPWSIMKLSFLLSIALGIVLVVAVALVWTVLNEMEVFAKIHGIVDDIGAQRQFGQLLEYLEFSRVISPRRSWPSSISFSSRRSRRSGRSSITSSPPWWVVCISL